MAQPLPAGQMDLDRHAGRGAGPTRSAQGFLLIRRKAAGDTDFADEPGEQRDQAVADALELLDDVQEVFTNALIEN